MDERVKTRGAGSHSEYLRDLASKGELEAAKDNLRGLILAGLQSPPGRSWDVVRADLLQRVRSHTPSG